MRLKKQVVKKKKFEIKKFKFLVFPIIFGLLAVTLIKFETRVQGRIFKTPELKRRLTYITYERYGHNSNVLSAVDEVLNRLHMDKIDLKNLHFENVSMDWDLLWCHHHQNEHKMNWSSLKYHQKINHFPNNIVLVLKSVLGAYTNSKYIPKAFQNSESVQKYAAGNPKKLFVMKLKSNKGIKLTKPEDMNFTATPSVTDYFAQEFIRNPLLWNGHKFDISFFVVITSVNPLRLYYYNKFFALRFCPKPYNISDPDDVSSYVIADDLMVPEEFEPVKKYLINGYTVKEAFESFMLSQGANLTEFWLKVEDLIRTIVMGKEKFLIEGIANTGSSKYNYFELFRFDMLIDEEFNLFLIEVNMSPNLLLNHKRIELIKYNYENILFNLFNLIGVGTTYEKSSFKSNFPFEKMVVNPDSISVLPETCLSTKCKNCQNESCKLCWKCLDETAKHDINQAYVEQINIGNFNRLFPPNEEFMKTANDEFWKELLEGNRLHLKWFLEMCKKNKKFC